jgi:hypothetical protein
MAEENRYIAAKASRPCFETDKHVASIELDPDSNAPLPSVLLLITAIFRHNLEEEVEGGGACGERR